MIRLIFSSKRWHSDLEWGRKPREEPAEEVHEVDLESITQVVPEDFETEDSTVAKAHKVIGFRPNREESQDES